MATVTVRNGRPPGSAAPVAGMYVEWAGGSTPCRRMPDFFEEVTTALDRQRAAHLCLAHCPQLDTCRRDREQADPHLAAGHVFAGRLTSRRRHAEITIHPLPSSGCPLPPAAGGCGGAR